MSKKTLIEAIVAALLLAIEVLVVLIVSFERNVFYGVNSYLMYVLVIFTNIDVVYGVIILIINTNRKDK